jgi:pyruvate,water dikinase
VARWEQVVKPASILAHRALLAVDPASLGTDEFLDHLARCREHQRRMIRQHHAFDCAALVPVGDFMAHVADWTGRPLGEFLALTRGYAPESAGSFPALDRLVAAIRQSPAAQAAIAAEVTAEDALEWLRSASGKLGAAAAAYLEIVSCRLLDSLDTGDPYALEVPQVLVEGSGSPSQAVRQPRATRPRRRLREYAISSRRRIAPSSMICSPRPG